MDKNNQLKIDIHKWLNKIRITDNKYRFSIHSNSNSLFNTLFSVFIHHLIGDVETWTNEKKSLLSNYINEHQDKETGFFNEPEITNNNLKRLFQLNTFSLSALLILKSEPKYKLKFIEEFSSKIAIEKYLNKYKCLSGEPGSGNFAMFLAIFLTFEYENTRNNKYLHLIEYWFELHNDFQKRNGTWSKSLEKYSIWGFQNALHQLIIYNYWNRCPPNISSLIKTILKLQDNNGNYGLCAGGGGCYDYDASFILLGFKEKVSKYYQEEIESQSIRLRNAIINQQNEDGGFCETNLYPKNILEFLTSFKCFSKDKNIISLYYRLLDSSKKINKNNQYNINHWSIGKYRLDHSDLWNTWFRTLTIAQIESVYLNDTSWKFQDFVGFGNFKY